jgi:hypothetical protein
VVTCTSTNIQAKLDLASPGIHLTREPPSLLLHALVAGELVTHLQPV